MLSDYSLGLDFGTSSVRAVLVACEDGRERTAATVDYARGDHGVFGDPVQPELARQHPADYTDSTIAAIRRALAAAPEIGPDRVVGIGVDTTASTPLPLDATCTPLATTGRFAERLEAMAWLWKDHTSHAEAAEITALARARRPEYLDRCGGTYSSEWFWSKLLRCARQAPDVFQAAHTWVELCDFVPVWLCGIRDPAAIPRSVCAAGHKGLWADRWGGYPDAAFLDELHPQLARIRATLPREALAVDRGAGRLGADVAAATGLREGTPVAVGAIDAHLGAVGAGVRPGDVVKVVGTSTCDMAVVGGDTVPDVPGLCGVVRGSIVPGLFGVEAGQSAVGDIFGWCARVCGDRPLVELEREAGQIAPGSSGLLALDWHNGNRCVLVDPELTGAVVGLTLRTTASELYRAMIEATAFGARVIVERMVESGVPVERVVACGGIARKSPLVMQVLADVLGRDVLVSAAEETCALGAAICGAVAAGRFSDIEAAQRAMCRAPATRYAPSAGAAATYDALFGLYRQLHDAFGVAGDSADLADVMKSLLAIRRQVR